MKVAIDATEEGEICAQGRDIRVKGIVNLHGNDVVRADHDVGGHVEGKRGEPALVLAQIVAVEPDVGDQERAIEFQEELPSGIPRAYRVMSPIPTDAAVVIVPAVFSVQIVPSVRQLDNGPG